LAHLKLFIIHNTKKIKLEIAIVPLDGGGVNLLEKRCFGVLKKNRNMFFSRTVFQAV